MEVPEGLEDGAIGEPAGPRPRLQAPCAAAAAAAMLHAQAQALCATGRGCAGLCTARAACGASAQHVRGESSRPPADRASSASSMRRSGCGRGVDGRGAPLAGARPLRVCARGVAQPLGRRRRARAAPAAAAQRGRRPVPSAVSGRMRGVAVLLAARAPPPRRPAAAATAAAAVVAGPTGIVCCLALPCPYRSDCELRRARRCAFHVHDWMSCSALPCLACTAATASSSRARRSASWAAPRSWATGSWGRCWP